MENEVRRAIETLKSIQYQFDSSIDDANTGEETALEALEDNTMCVNAISMAIAALEWQEKKMCEYCKPEPGIRKAQGVDCWQVDIKLNEVRYGFAAKFCGNCGRDLRKLEG